MIRVKPAIIALTILTAVGTGSVLLSQKQNEASLHAWSKLAPAEDNEVFEKMLECKKKGDFDGAVALALKGVNGKPADDFLLQAVSSTYFERAQQDNPSRREQWVTSAVQYSERALAANPRDVVNVFNIGETYLTAAMNLQKPNSCGYYEKALGVFERLKTDPILKGEWATIEGERVPMEPYRQRLDDEIKQVRQLSSGCPAMAKTQ
jgi:tetratricopeptide (TPR) repeat protein